MHVKVARFRVIDPRFGISVIYSRQDLISITQVDVPGDTHGLGGGYRYVYHEIEL